MFNYTRVYLNTRSSKRDHVRVIYRVPVPQENEKFFFNQELVQVSINMAKRSDMASIHVTNKRLIMISQLSSIGPPLNSEFFDTFEIALNQFKSLKLTQLNQRLLHCDILLINQENLKIDITYNNKNDASRSGSLIEYLKMAVASSQTATPQWQERQIFAQDDILPTYLEATQSLPPPAYN